jgi:2-dehydro-3-deoxyphosphogalactonate aldolase
MEYIMSSNSRANHAPTSSDERFANAFSSCSLIAILRGIKPQEAVAHAQALYEKGFRIIEVPLNSPSPFDSIEAMKNSLPSDAVIGAGTVLKVADVERVKSVGGEIIVMPHRNSEIIRCARKLGLVSAPGVATPSEAFAALKAGANVLKMFPFEQLGEKVIKAWRAVIAADIALVPVGGITPSNVSALLAAGASGFGLGSALYKPGQTVDVTSLNATNFVSALTEFTR